jgi:hypothetical protein
MNHLRKLRLASFLFSGSGCWAGELGAVVPRMRDGQINFDVSANLTALSGQESLARITNASVTSAMSRQPSLTLTRFAWMHRKRLLTRRSLSEWSRGGRERHRWEWSRGDASDMDGKADRLSERERMNQSRRSI